MTRTKRVFTVLKGLIMLAFAAALVLLPKYALNLILGTISIGMTVEGFRTLWYYLTMARFMVGGKSVLFRAIIFLDLGILSTSLTEAPGAAVILYLAAINGFNGAVDVLRAREQKTEGSPHWKFTGIHGAVDIILAAAVVVCGLFLRMPQAAVYIYTAGLVSSAVMTIISAFRRTAIVYIQ